MRQVRSKAPGRSPPPSGSGSALEFDAVYTEHFHHVARWARALGGLDADIDDLAQDVFMVVRRKLGDLRWAEPARLAIRHHAQDRQRLPPPRCSCAGCSRGGIRSLEITAEPSPTRGDALVRRLEAQRILLRVLGRMSEVRRTAFILFEIEGYSGEEIAELEQIPLATVYTRLHHARKDFLRFTAEITGDAPEEPPP